MRRTQPRAGAGLRLTLIASSGELTRPTSRYSDRPNPSLLSTLRPQTRLASRSRPPSSPAPTRRDVFAGVGASILAASRALAQNRARIGWLTVAPHPGWPRTYLEQRKTPTVLF